MLNKSNFFWHFWKGDFFCSCPTEFTLLITLFFLLHRSSTGMAFLIQLMLSVSLLNYIYITLIKMYGIWAVLRRNRYERDNYDTSGPASPSFDPLFFYYDNMNVPLEIQNDFKSTWGNPVFSTTKNLVIGAQCKFMVTGCES